MEVQLQELIDQIKKDGVEAAQMEAESILKTAKEDAEEIIAAAKAEAKKILSDAENENKRMVKSSEEAIRQAGRNLLLSFRESVTKEFNAVLRDNVMNVYSSSDLAGLIVKAVEAWTKNPDSDDVSVLLTDKDLEQLKETLLMTFNEKMLKGVTLKANNDFDGGFRIAVDNGRAYYDYSADTVVEMLSAYLNPKVTALLKEAESL